MSRALRQRDAQAQAPAAQLEHLAFNIRGHAMEDGMQDRKDRIEYICAYSQGGQYVKAVSQALQQQEEALNNGEELNENEPLFRIDNVYSKREKEDPQPGVKLFMVVGYTPRQANDNITKTATKKQQAVGVKAPDSVDIIKWDSEKPPVLVVTEVLEQQPEGVQLWALIKPRNFLCTPHAISQDLVFYRSEFRDNTTDIKSRGVNWNTKVTFHSVKPGLNAAPLTEKQQKFKRARDPAKLVFDPNVSLCNEIASLAANYNHTKEQWYLQEIKTVLRAVDDDLNYRPLPENPGLRLFIEAEEPLDDDQSELVVSDFLEMWPNTPHVVAKNIKVLHHALLDEQVYMEYRLLKPFVTETCWLMGEGEVNEEGLGLMIKKTLGTLKRTYGSTKCTPSISMDDQNALLVTIIAKLKEIMQAGTDAEEKMKSSLGEAAFEHNSQDIWARFGEAADTDTARAAWCQELKLVVAGARQKEAGLRGMIEDLITPLSKLNL